MSTSTDFKTLEIPVDGVNSYIPPIIINEADNDGRNLKFIPLQDGQPVTGFTSARLYYDPRPKDAYSVGGYIDGTQDGDGWTFVIPANTFTADMQGNGSVSFTDSDGETYTRNIQFLVESGGTKALSQGSKIDQLVALLQSMVNDFTMTAEAETGAAGSQANVTVTLLPSGAYNLNFTIPTGPQGPKGDPGDLTTVAHDESLSGDGTADNALKISENMVPLKSTDLIDGNIDNLTPGFYMYRGPSSRPGYQYGSLIVLQGTSNQSKQIAVDVNSTGVSRMFVRGMGQTLEYGDWWEVAHQSDIAGTFRNPIKVEKSDLGDGIFDANEYTTPGVYSISLLKSQASEQSIPEYDNIYIRACLIVVRCGSSNNDLAQIWINRAGDAGVPFIAMRIKTDTWQQWQRLGFASVTQESFSSVELETRIQALEAEVESLKNKQ